MNIINIEVAGYPDVMQTGANVMAVITQDSLGKYAVYVGIVRLADFDPDHPEFYQESKRLAAGCVAQWGAKQSERDARKYFTFPEGSYRH